LDRLTTITASTSYGLLITGSSVGQQALYVSNTGYVGIGGTNPTAFLSLPATSANVSSLNIKGSASAPTSPNYGDIYTSSSETANSVFFYNGSAWQDLATGGGTPVNLWTQGASTYMYTSTANQALGNVAAAGANKLTGIYLTDTAPIYFGYQNNTNIQYRGSDSSLALALGNNNLKIDEDTLFVSGSENKVGIGTSNLVASLTIKGTAADSIVSGSNQVTNGTFAASNPWVWGSNWTWNQGAQRADISSASEWDELTQNVGVQYGKKYKIEFTVSNVQTGNAEVYLGNVFAGEFDSDGTYAFDVTALDSSDLVLAAYQLEGSIDDVAVYEILPGSGASPVLALLNDVGEIAMEFRTGAGGEFNNFIGIDAGRYSTYGGNNVALGKQALYTNVGDYNIALGYQALYSSQGSNNLAMGQGALLHNSGDYNLAMGQESLYNNSGDYNLAMGQGALQNNIGSYNLAMGQSALNNTNGSGNLAMGQYALRYNSGSFNLAMGYSALNNNSGSNNLAMGQNALESNRGSDNLAMGYYALRYNSGSYNLAMGYNTLLNNSGSDNLAMGYSALLNNSGSYNLAMGRFALYRNSGSYNLAMGYNTLQYNSGNNNIAIGSGAMYWNQYGDNNIVIGNNALRSNSGGDFNIVLGDEAFYANSGGSYNLMLGYRAGRNVNGGSGNVIIGPNAGLAAVGSFANTLWIANTSGGLPLIYGKFGFGTVGIGTTNPTAFLSLPAVSANVSSLNIKGSASAPTSPNYGDIYTSSSETANSVFFYNGSAWQDLATGGGTPVNLWTQGAATYMYTSTANQALGNVDAAGANKLTGIYLTDTAPIYFGYQNSTNIQFRASDSSLALALGNYPFKIDEDTLFVSGSENRVGIGTSSLSASLTVRGTNTTAAILSTSNQVTNGTFTATSDPWTWGTYWSWNSGSEQADISDQFALGGILSQSVGVETDHTYKVSFTVGTTSDPAEFAMEIKLGNTSLGTINEGGSFSATVVAQDSTDTISFTVTNLWVGYIDDVSVYEILPASGGATPILALLNDTGDVAMEIRTGSGALNNYIGKDAGRYSVSGDTNVGLGNQALYYNRGNENVALGYLALNSNRGDYNVAMGSSTLLNNSGSYNLATGFEALRKNVGSNNVAIGNKVLWNNTGSNNIAIGGSALVVNFGQNNLAIGNGVLYGNSGGRNQAIGNYALFNNQNGSDNLAIGYYTLYSNSGDYNLAMGVSALQGNRGSNNLAMGNLALYNNSGSFNQAFGFNTMYSNSGGNNNIAIGSGAMYWSRFADNNIAIGNGALRSNSGGDYNIVLGDEAFYANSGGSQNLMLGYRAGRNVNGGSGNVIIGPNAGLAAVGSFANTLWIANTSGGIPLIYGDFNIGKIGIGLTNPSAFLTIRPNSEQVASLNLRASASAPTTPVFGDIYTSSNEATTSLFFYNGTIWKDLTAGGASTWTDVGAYQYPNGDVLGNSAAAGANKLTGIYLTDTAPIYMGYDNDAYLQFAHSDNSLTLALGETKLRIDSAYQNYSLGYQNNIIAGSYDIALGYQAMYSNSGASNNIAFGYQAMYSNSAGSNNIAIGSGAMYWSQLADNNVAIGNNALRSNSQGDYNIVLGYQALSSNSGGSYNMAFGYQALQTNTSSGSYNMAFGYQALKTNSGSNNLALGEGALIGNKGEDNLAIGASALDTNSGDYNLAIGNQALWNNSGSDNLAMGHYALQHNSGSNNVAMGDSALSTNSGSYNVAIGLNTLTGNTGSDNLAIGQYALQMNNGSNNQAFGNRASRSSQGSYNLAMGQSTLYNNSGSYNQALGYYAMYSNSGGSNNIAIGSGAMYWSQLADNNIVIGNMAMASNSGGDFNIVLGEQAFSSNSGGSYNLMLGYRAGRNVNGGSGNVIIGANAGLAAVGSFANTLWIANTSGGTPLIYGNFATGNVGVGTTNPTSKLTIAGTSSMISNAVGDIVISATAGSATLIRSASGSNSTLDINTVDSALTSTLRFSNSGKNLFFMHTNQVTDLSRLYVTDSGNSVGVYLAPGTTSWQAASDARLKENVALIDNALAKVMQMRGVTYNLKGNGVREIGVVAQEVNPLFPEIVDDPTNGYWGVMYDRIGPILIEAIKEQQFQIAGLTDSAIPQALTGISTLGGQVTSLNSQVLNLQSGFSQLSSLSGQMLNLQSSFSQLTSLSGQIESLESMNGQLISMSSQVDSLLAAASENTTAISLLEDKVNLINEVLGLNTLQSSESTSSAESTQSTTSLGLSGILADITQTVDNFKGFITALGLRADEQTQSLIVDSNLNVMGNTTLTNVTITGDLQAGLMKFNTLENSLDVLGVSCFNPDTKELDDILCQSQTLYLQRSLAGNLDIFNGKIVLEPNGTLKVQGTVEAEKFAVNTTKTESATAGKAIIPTGETIFEIKTTAVNGQTLILVTPERPVALGSRISDTGDSFIITLKDPEAEDLPVNWLLVEAKN
jgi:hypothetical protein